jgi:tetratricopeptide (TPR) repeat protein
MNRLSRVVAAVVVLALFTSGAGLARQDEDLIQRAFDAYAAGDEGAIARIVPHRYLQTITGVKRTEREVDRLVDRWSQQRRALLAVFLIELADHDLREWTEGAWRVAIERGRRMLTGRRSKPGEDAQEDAFEIAWHETALSLVSGLGDPDSLNRVVVEPLRDRVVAVRSTEEQLVDPCIDLARAFVEERRTLADPRTLPDRGPRAVAMYEAVFERKAGSSDPAHEPRWAEAQVRRAWLLLRLSRHAEAMAALDAVDESVTDSTVRYWRELFRARALEGLGRDEDAARVYGDALGIVPDAQSALTGLASVLTRLGRTTEAEQAATRTLTSAARVRDPWIPYGWGDFRFYRQRLEALRVMAR